CLFFAPLRRRGHRDPFANIAALRLLYPPFIPFSYASFLHRKDAEVAEILLRTLRLRGKYHLPSFLFPMPLFCTAKAQRTQRSLREHCGPAVITPPLIPFFLCPLFAPQTQ
ncbi:hypothetical protein, partial [Membranihabitans maritimus]|uniref:hypothetical protein n=1 Tax=Membranihabitans maritimus TaxID=2904244 RepID=UPI001F48990C